MSLSIFDRIEIAIAIGRGERDFRKEQANFKKEQKRANRAAGNDKNSGANPDSNTGNKKPFDSKKNKKGTTQKPQESQNPNEQKKDETPVVESPKTEQQINAEAQAPEEAAGAEKVKNIKTTAHTVVEEEPQAAMSSTVRVDDTNPSHMDFSYFGDNMHIDLDKMNGGAGTSGNLFNQQPIQNPNQRPFNFNPAATMMNGVPGGNPTMPQFEMDPTMCGMNTYGQMLNQQQVPIQGVPNNPVQQPPQQFVTNQPPVGYGYHRVDMPENPKPTRPKSKPDIIDMEGMPNVIEGSEVTHFPKFNATTVGVVEDKPSMQTEPVPLVNKFKENNEKYFKEFPFLIEIEKLALNKGYQIGFVVRPTKLIDCYIYNDNNVVQPIQGKGFTIDPGMIIDRRKKVFACIANFYEGENAYPLFIAGKSNNGKKGDNVLNAELLTNLIVGGNMSVHGIRGMYTDDFRNLNKYVALITMPTNKNSPEDRKYMQNRLVDLYKANIYEDALMGSNARFGVVEYIKSSGTILLDTTGIHTNYGGTIPDAERVQIKITKSECRVLRGDSIIDVIPSNHR